MTKAYIEMGVEPLDKDFMKAKLEELGNSEFRVFLDEKLKSGEISYVELLKIAVEISEEIGKQLDDWDELIFHYLREQS